MLRQRIAKCREEVAGGCSAHDEGADLSNCIFECISPECNAKVYGQEPLEEGEIDSLRENKFRLCVSNEGRVKPVRG